MNRRAIYLPASMLLLAAGAVMAHSTTTPGTATPRSESATMKGEIIDPQCYFTHDSRGPAHASCAATCARGGQGLSFLEDASGIVYPLIAKTHGASQNEGLLPHLGKPVQVKGTIYRKQGGSVLLIQSVADLTTKAK